MPKYRIDWKSCSQWAGTERTMDEGEELYLTKEEAEAALEEFRNDADLQMDLHHAAVEDQGVEGWMEVVKVDE